MNNLTSFAFFAFQTALTAPLLIHSHCNYVLVKIFMQRETELQRMNTLSAMKC